MVLYKVLAVVDSTARPVADGDHEGRVEVVEVQDPWDGPCSDVDEAVVAEEEVDDGGDGGDDDVDG